MWNEFIMVDSWAFVNLGLVLFRNVFNSSTVNFVFTWERVKNIHTFWKQNQTKENGYNYDYWKHS